MGEPGYGSWRSITAADAVSLSFGFPFPESFPNDELAAAAEALLEEEPERALSYVGGESANRLPSVVVERARERGVD